MLPNKSTHPKAEIDLPLGRARIPANCLCRAGSTTDNKPRYVQCSPADLDLFDGVNEHDEFDSIGIGDKQPRVYANLCCNDRMRLGVLKV